MVEQAVRSLPPLLMLEAAVEPVPAVVEEQAVVEQPVVEQPVEQPVVVQSVVMQAGRAAKRAHEDELLIEYEASKMGRADFAAEKNMPLGTIDGIFARARKRQVQVAQRC